MLKFYDAYMNQLFDGMKDITVTDKDENVLEIENAMKAWCDMTKDTSDSQKTIFFIGNGASSAMASHMSADMSKNGDTKSMTFSDFSLLTAVSNDINYEHSYAVPLKRFSTEGDMLITISSSGNSPNIIKAIEIAKEKKLKVVTLSGMKKDNKSRKYGDLNFYIPLNEYGLVEAAHQALLHCWLDKYFADRGIING